MKKFSGTCPEPIDVLSCTKPRDGEVAPRLAEAARTTASFFLRLRGELDPMLEAGVDGRYTLALVSSPDDDPSLELESDEESDSSSDSEESELSDSEESEDEDVSIGGFDRPWAPCRRNGPWT